MSKKLQNSPSGIALTSLCYLPWYDLVRLIVKSHTVCWNSLCNCFTLFLLFCFSL
ncbi:hypothetical protein KFK09_012488 [Dendrobium nobile]|uniref:Uncharacterized protein n=1 Tax=Dendrobium nobile TaxID=94219 RepID=A0A8T3BHJ9_DENNO|nr:hypothetical protein KFK09_012488 [Dendrobium nobile]